ncbi:hypothetical protein FS749_004047 [Ceratobasidium sp. UAMH 11750]|nr:hypothetical protein FS749_004047 [Ceratobasidium sp. UAMH 11750]
MPSKKRKQKQPKVKRSVDADEDALQWISSNSEAEDYGNLGDKERWVVDGITDLHRGENDRMSYKIRWNKDDWCREDGTSEEWIPAPKKNCTEHQTLIRKHEAEEFDYFDSLSHIIAEQKELYPFFNGAPAVSKNYWLQAGVDHALVKPQKKLGGDLRKAGFMIFGINDRDFARGEFDSESEEDEVAPPRSQRQRQPKREPSDDPRPPPSPSLGGSRNPSQAVDPDEPSQLEKLAETWTERAEAVGAAYITFTNDSDTPDALPMLNTKFKYSEMDLKWGPEVGPDSFDGMFASCRCSDQCEWANQCGCQDPLFEDIVEVPRGLHKFAYNSKGLFRLDHQGVVIECNKSCRCASNCPNRVAQQPRSVPLDIFTPSIRGWGVRPLRSIKAGQVLGTFTGEIITREAAENVSHDTMARELSTGGKVQFHDGDGYLFDLDARHNNYTLNCWKFGNWTRFLKLRIWLPDTDGC